jgi:acetylornithine deacetylase/succinyl-diaminopimelate desuccinylase-like protein
LLASLPAIRYNRSTMRPAPATLERLRRTVNRQRLVDTACELIAMPSRTGEAGAAADRLAQILTDDGFHVERPTGGYTLAPAVAVRFTSGKPGRTIQFNGHLDTVHLPFVPPQVEGDRITGSGSSDMKAGIAAAVEAMRALRDAEALAGGSILLTAHDLHESPWGDGRQLDQLIRDGYVGDAVLLPEYLNDCLPVVGRGGLIWKAIIRRPGAPVHEVLRPADEPSVIGAGAELAARLRRLNECLAAKTDPLAGSESLFIGQIHSGEIYNQYPQECSLEGTRRWLPGTPQSEAENEIRRLCKDLAGTTGTTISLSIAPMRDAFLLDQNDPLVPAFQQAYEATAGKPLPIGAKPFVDDGNSFWALAKVPAITHGPRAGGPHTLNEWVSIDDLVRVALVYALTAVAYCGESVGSAVRTN